MNRDSRREKERREERERERERERTQRWLSQRQNIFLVPYDGAGSSGV